MEQSQPSVTAQMRFLFPPLLYSHCQSYCQITTVTEYQRTSKGCLLSSEHSEEFGFFSRHSMRSLAMLPLDDLSEHLKTRVSVVAGGEQAPALLTGAEAHGPFARSWALKPLQEFEDSNGRCDFGFRGSFSTLRRVSCRLQHRSGQL